MQMLGVLMLFTLIQLTILYHDKNVPFKILPTAYFLALPDSIVSGKNIFDKQAEVKHLLPGKRPNKLQYQCLVSYYSTLTTSSQNRIIIRVKTRQRATFSSCISLPQN